MSYLLIFLMIMMYTLQSFFCKLYTDAYPGNPSMASNIFSVVSGVIVAIAGFAVSGFLFSPSPLTVVFGLINAVVLAGFNYSMVGASQNGPYSVLMVFMLSGGILVPMAVSALAFGNIPSVGKWISVAVIVVAIYLVSKKKESKAKPGLKFRLFCIGLFLTNGLYGSLFDIQQRITGIGEKEEMIIVTYLAMALGSALFMLIRRKKQLPNDFIQTKRSLLFLLLCSAVMAVAINLLVFIITIVDTTVLFTFDNAGVLLFSVLFSAVFLKEKLSAVNIAGSVMMAAGLVFICIL